MPMRMRALATGLPATAQAAPQPTLKPAALDTIKEMAWGEHTLKALTYDHTLKELTVDQTLKEVTHDPKYIKEVVKEMAKEVAWDPIPDWGSTVTNPAITQVAGGVPFVLATPHQAPQGAVAQQMLAAQALAGRLGY